MALLVRLSGAFERVSTTLPGRNLFIQFFVNAECEIGPGDRFRIVAIKPGDPKDVERWWAQ